MDAGDGRGAFEGDVVAVDSVAREVFGGTIAQGAGGGGTGGDCLSCAVVYVQAKSGDDVVIRQVAGELHIILARAAIESAVDQRDAMHAGDGPQELVSNDGVVGSLSFHLQDARHKREVVRNAVVQFVEQMRLPSFRFLARRYVEEELRHLIGAHTTDPHFMPLPGS